ncbi:MULTISPECIES: site-specific integrase [Achromobacter]|uniref:Phage integrase family protein 9 n=1 Tax=Achromobacter xylosoxidans (strain A8) TaxID=762376 RepID=E3HY69_ACHXA|nr:site-specific integrase [Achromobacter xylosoxidans]ADP20023.1 phage integrase family protein 9 [Achromobacter xylosoxidans A8]
MKNAPKSPSNALADRLAVVNALQEGLGASDASIQALLHEGSSANTLASYRAAIQYWAAWHQLRLGHPFALPVPVKTVLQFIADHVEHTTDQDTLVHDLPPEVDAALIAARVKRFPGPFKLATVRHRLAVLSEAHETQGLPNPCRTRAVQIVMERTRSAYTKRGVRPARKDAITKQPLEELLATCDDSLSGLRDRALLLFAWASGGRRRSEVVRASLENTRRVPEGFLYTMGQSKTNQEGVERSDQHKPIVGRAAQALEAWLTAANISSGPIFRRVRRGGVIGERLSEEAVRKIVKARAALAGLEGDFSAHSLRSGFITEAGRQGVPLGETMAMSGHVSVASVVGYHRAGAAVSSRAGRLLEDEPGDPSS